MADLQVRSGSCLNIASKGIITTLFLKSEDEYLMLSYQEDEDDKHVTIQLEDTQQVLKVNKKFIEKVTIHLKVSRLVEHHHQSLSHHCHHSRHYHPHHRPLPHG